MDIPILYIYGLFLQLVNRYVVIKIDWIIVVQNLFLGIISTYLYFGGTVEILPVSDKARFVLHIPDGLAN